MMIRTVCPHDCPDQCSVLATVEDGRVVRVGGDPEHPFTRGFLCTKVNRYPERVHSPERLLTPLRRIGPKGEARFTPITWDEALAEIVERWQATFAEYGPQALLGYAYSGHMGLINRNLYRALFHALGSTQMNAGTVCDSACEAGWAAAVGETPGTDPETVSDSDLILAWGANIVTTNVHLVPFVDEAVKRGARFVVIDPYRTRTARRATWHIQPRVGTDAALALGLMHVLVRENLHDRAYIAARTTGFDRLCTEVLPAYTPERVAEITGVPAGDVERLARLYGEARAPFIRLGMGMSRHSGGGMTIRTVAMLPAVVGAWGKPGGGALLETASAWGFDFGAIRRPELLPHQARAVNHSTLGRDLLELNDPPIRALFVAANNPAVTCPDSGRMREALCREDLFTVVHDTFLSDTARYADIVLPASTAFETEDLYRSYGTYYVQYGRQVIEPQGDSRSNAWVAAALAHRLGHTDPVFARSPREHVAGLLRGATGPTAALDPDAVLSGAPVKLACAQSGPARTWFVDAAGELPGWSPDPAAATEYPLRLLTAPGHHQHHTSFAGVAALEKAEGVPRCLLHPDDAAARSVRDGEPVELYNDLGAVGLVARVTADTLPGVVVVEGERSQARYLSGGPLNVLVADRLSDLGEGATYQSTWLDVRPHR